jgi:hypothetical protein
VLQPQLQAAHCTKVVCRPLKGLDKLVEPSGKQRSQAKTVPNVACLHYANAFLLNAAEENYRPLAAQLQYEILWSSTPAESAEGKIICY